MGSLALLNSYFHTYTPNSGVGNSAQMDPSRAGHAYNSDARP